MTEQEAQELIARVRTKGSYTGDYYMGYTDSLVPFNEDIDILADALLKQIPKKPIRIPQDDGGLYNAFVCPCCGEVLVYGVDKPFVGVRKSHHCVCGQAIDWSE